MTSPTTLSSISSNNFVNVPPGLPVTGEERKEPTMPLDVSVLMRSDKGDHPTDPQRSVFAYELLRDVFVNVSEIVWSGVRGKTIGFCIQLPCGLLISGPLTAQYDVRKGETFGFASGQLAIPVDHIAYAPRLFVIQEEEELFSA